MEKLTLNRKEAAKYLGVAENTFVRILRDGKIPYIREGRRLLIPRKCIEEYVNKATIHVGKK